MFLCIILYNLMNVKYAYKGIVLQMSYFVWSFARQITIKIMVIIFYKNSTLYQLDWMQVIRACSHMTSAKSGLVQTPHTPLSDFLFVGEPSSSCQKSKGIFLHPPPTLKAWTHEMERKGLLHRGHTYIRTSQFSD